MSKLFRLIISCLTTFFGLGKSKYMPGTVGSLGAFPFLYLVHTDMISFFVYCAICVFLFLLGIWASNMHERINQTHDASEIVIDEVVGQMIAFVPLIVIDSADTLNGPSEYALWALSFCLFRFFDILKPFPINWLDKNISRGLGVMLDDVAAGVFAALLLWIGLEALLP